MNIQDLPVPAVLTSPNFIVSEANTLFSEFIELDSGTKATALKTYFSVADEFLEFQKLLKEKSSITSLPVTLARGKKQKVNCILAAQKLKNNSGQIIITFIPGDKNSQQKDKNQPESMIRLKNMYAFLNNIPIPIVITSIEGGKIIDANKSFKQVTGYKKEEVLGKTSQELNSYIHSDDREKILRTLKEKGEIENYEIQFRVKSGKAIHTLATSKIIKIEGKPCLLSTIHDITEKKESEKKLAENEKQLKTFLNVAPVGIGTAKERVFTYVNNTFCMLTGYTEDEILGQDSSIIYPDPDAYKTVGKTLYREIKKIGSATMETKIKNKNGKIIDVFLSGTAIDPADISNGIVFSFRDISEIKRSEFLKELVYNIANAVVATPNLFEFIKMIRKELGKAINTANFYIALYDKKTDSLSTPYLADEKDDFTSWSAKKTLTGYVVKKRKPLFVSKDEINELKNSGEIDLVGTVSEVWIGIPLIIDNTSIGALVVQDYENPFAYSKADFEMLTFISSQVSISIDRKRSEDTIRELQKNVELQIKQMPNGLITWDKYFQVKSWNPSAESIFGYSEEEVIGKHVIELIVPDDQFSEIETLWEEVICSENETTYVTENITNAGATIICRWQFTPLRNEEGNITGALSMVEDITEKEIARKELIASEEKYKSLVDHSPDGIFTVDIKGKFESVNFAVCNFTGKTERELLKMTVWDIVPKKFKMETQKRLLNIKNGQNLTSPLEYEILNKDGKVSFIEVVSTPFYQNNILMGFQSIARDVTFRKKAQKKIKLYQEKLESLVRERTAKLERQTQKLSESHQAMSFLVEDVNKSREELLQSNNELKKLSQAIEQSPVAVIITDTKGNIEYVNRHFCEVTGYKADEVRGKNPRIQNSGVHPKEFFRDLWSKINSGENWHGEICNTKKNTERYWEFISISPLRDTKNNISHFIAVKEDITQRKIAEEKLKTYTEELEVFNKAMIDRELKIIEMKEQVNKLSSELGRGVVYEPVWK